MKSAAEFFEAHFRWEAGEYQAMLRISTDPPNAAITKAYRFTLFETESVELRSYANDFRFGGAVYFTMETHVGVITPIYES